LLVLLVVLVAGCGGASNEPSAVGAGPSVSVQLAPIRSAGAPGTATIAAEGEVFDVTISLDQPVDGITSHIHSVPCARYSDAIAQRTIVGEIGEVKNGKAQGSIFIEAGQVTDGTHSIVIHAPKPPYSGIVCGDIPKQ
jgi:hypothetical protein